MDFQQNINELMEQKAILDQKMQKIKSILQTSNERQQAVAKQIHKLEKQIISLRIKKRDIEEKELNSLQQVDIESTELNVLEKIKQLSTQIFISNDDLCKLLKKRTGKDWQIKILGLSDGPIGYHSNGLPFICALKPGHNKKLNDKKDFYGIEESLQEGCTFKFFDKYASYNFPIGLYDYAILSVTLNDYTNPYPTTPIKTLQETNWYETYLIKKIIGRYPDAHYVYNKLLDDSFGKLMYSVIDEYVQSLVAGNGATQKPTTRNKK